MFKRGSIWVCFSLAGCGQVPFFAPPPPLPAVQHPTPEELAQDEVEPGKYLVGFRGPSTMNRLHFRSFLSESQFYDDTLRPLYESDPRVLDIHYITTEKLVPLSSSQELSQETWLAPANHLSWSQSPGQPVLTTTLGVVTFRSAGEAQEVLGEWLDHGDILFADPDYKSSLSEDFTQHKNDYTELESQTNGWWHKNINLSGAFEVLTKPKEENKLQSLIVQDVAVTTPVIAVMDSGVDYEHEFLKDRIWVNGSMGASGCLDDEHGCDTTNPPKGTLGTGTVYPSLTDGPSQACPVDSEKKTDEKCSHGTHVAGIIAAKYNKENGVGGVCPVCQIMILRVTKASDSGGKTSLTIADSAQLAALKYVTRFERNGGSLVRIINASFGKYSRSRSIAIMVDVLKRLGQGTILIAAAGNEDSMSRAYPASLAEVVAVAALEKDSRKATYSNFGPWVDIAAPGGGAGYKIVSTIPASGTSEKVGGKNGTSMASPVVAGALGLYLAVNPGASVDDMRERLLSSADGDIYLSDKAEGINYQYYFQKIAGEKSRRPLLGSGILNVAQLVSKGKGKANLAGSIDRVGPGCGTITKSTELPLAYGPFIVPVLLWTGFPLLVTLFWRRRVSKG